MLLGIILLFLMVTQRVESTFFLNFFARGASALSLLFGTIDFVLRLREGRVINPPLERMQSLHLIALLFLHHMHPRRRPPPSLPGRLR